MSGLVYGKLKMNPKFRFSTQT